VAQCRRKNICRLGRPVNPDQGLHYLITPQDTIFKGPKMSHQASLWLNAGEKIFAASGDL